jgi:hypothetical protein
VISTPEPRPQPTSSTAIPTRFAKMVRFHIVRYERASMETVSIRRRIRQYQLTHNPGVRGHTREARFVITTPKFPAAAE